MDNTQLSLYAWVIEEKGATLTICIFNCIQTHSVFNRINASGFSVYRVLFVRVLMFFQHITLQFLDKV
jgi:hypothetical protein